MEADVDLLVAGSGAAGLSAAVTAAQGGARVLVIEKSGLLGGTSATSGGGVWIPCSPLAAAAGHPDDPDAAFAYLRTLTDAAVSDMRIRAYVEAAPRMLAWMAEHTPLRFVSVPYPDYHQDAPGAMPGWRSHFPVPIDGRQLGREVDLLRRTSPAASFLGIVNWNLEETHYLLHRPPGWKRVFAGMLWRYLSDVPQRLRGGRDRHLSLGNAIMGSLLLAARARGVRVERHTALRELLRERGRVCGAVLEQGGREIRVRARCGVVLATGGFERNAELRARWLPAQASDPGMSGSQRNNTGDGIRIAVDIGAALQGTDSAWWAPVFKVPGESRGRLCSFERAFPGCIMVNHAGRRFMNEAASYHVTAQTMIAQDRPEARTVPAWILFDHRFHRHYPMGPLLPLPLWTHGRAVRSIVHRANTWEEIAARTGLPSAALAQTLARFNVDAARGEDAEFGRGASEYDRYYGDARVQPNPTLAPLAEAPFYAMQLHLGDIGTNGGLVTDDGARVLDGAGVPIEGLYAAGNTTASVMGHAYPAAGATLGPALTFGHIAGLHCA